MICPACGWRQSPKWVAGLRAWGELVPVPVGFPCDGCGRVLRLVPGALNENGVGEDRLVPVQQERTE